MRTMTIALLAAGAVYAQEPPAGMVAQARVVTGGNFGFISERLVGGSPVKGAPYTAQAVTETTQTLADGNRIVQKSTAILYRDSEGRERREQTLSAIGPFTAQGDAPQIISISDPVAGINYSLNPKEKFAVKMPPLPPGLPGVPGAPAGGGANPNVDVFFASSRPGAGVASLGAGGAQVMIYRSGTGGGNAPNVEQLGSKIIEDVQADGTRTTITIPAGQMGNDRPIDIVDEQWRSSELQVTVLSRHSDPRMGETVYSLTNVSRSEPSPTLFHVPPDYTMKDGPVMLERKLAPQ
jgi:hypothetical protein